MKTLLPSPRLSTGPRSLHFSVCVSRFKLFECMRYGAFFHVYGQRVLTAVLSPHAKSLSLTFLFFFLFSAHAASLSAADSERTARAGLVKTVLQRSPHAVRRADFRCPDFTAVMLPPGTLHAESYVRCEDWNAYHGLMQDGKFSDAEKLILIFKFSKQEGN